VCHIASATPRSLRGTPTDERGQPISKSQVCKHPHNPASRPWHKTQAERTTYRLTKRVQVSPHSERVSIICAISTFNQSCVPGRTDGGRWAQMALVICYYFATYVALAKESCSGSHTYRLSEKGAWCACFDQSCDSLVNL